MIVRGQATPLLAGTFIRRVLPDECIWTINESRGTLDIVLGKFEGKRTFSVKKIGSATDGLGLLQMSSGQVY